MRAHLDVPGHGVEEALHDEDREGQLERRDDQDDAGQRVEQADPVHHQEDRDDQRHRREGVQDEQALEVAGAARGNRSARDSSRPSVPMLTHERHLRPAPGTASCRNAIQTLGNCRADARAALQRVGDVRVPQEAPVVEMEIRAGEHGEQRPGSRRPAPSPASAAAARSSSDEAQQRPEEQRRQQDAQACATGRPCWRPVRPEKATVTSQR